MKVKYLLNNINKKRLTYTLIKITYLCYLCYLCYFLFITIFCLVYIFKKIIIYTNFSKLEVNNNNNNNNL
jgi:hypothetical protein